MLGWRNILLLEIFTIQLVEYDIMIKVTIDNKSAMVLWRGT